MKCKMYELFQGYMAEYGHHPYYVVVDPDTGNTHSVLLFNSNAMGECLYSTIFGRKVIIIVTTVQYIIIIITVLAVSPDTPYDN